MHTVWLRKGAKGDFPKKIGGHLTYFIDFSKV